MQNSTVFRTRRRAWAALFVATTGALALAPVQGAAWHWQRTVEPVPPEPGAFGAAVAMSEGRLWIGPCQDRDLGQGPPQVWALELATGTRTTVMLPTLDRTAGFGLAVAACGRSAAIGAPSAGCTRDMCHTGEVWLAELGSVTAESPASPVASAPPVPPVPPVGPPALVRVPSPAPEAGAQFGASVALDERWLAVGSPWATVHGVAHAGCVDLFDRARGLQHAARLVSPRPSVSGHFGAALALQSGTLVVGEPGAPGQPPLGHAALGQSPPHGAAHVACVRQGAWGVQSSLRAPAGALGWYGASLALAGDDLVVGAPRAGAAVHLARTRHGQWRVVRVLQPPSAAAGFGCAVALGAGASVGTAIIGASADSTAAPYGGSAWLVDLATGAIARAPSPTPAEDQNVGAGVAISGPWAAIAVGGNPEQSPPAPGVVHLLHQSAVAWHSGP